MESKIEFDKKFAVSLISGSDEAGRGSLIGPVVAAIVIPDYNSLFEDVDDSKKLSPKKRDNIFKKITEKYSYSIGQASCEEIEQFNILNATIIAINRAKSNLISKTNLILVDGNMKFDDKIFHSIIGGDSKSYAIACASIVAKCYRDNLIDELSDEYPEYGWRQNKGYGTKSHIESIQKYGINIHHRKSFLKKILSSPWTW